MGSKESFIEVENRIRSLTTILNNYSCRVPPSSDPKGLPSFLQHFANLLSTGYRNSPDAGKVISVTGFLLPDRKTSTLVVAQDSSSKSDVRNLRIEDVSKSRKSFDEIVDLNRDDNVVLKEYISDLWAALTHYQSHPDRYANLHLFVVYRSYRQLFKRARQDRKMWRVDVAEKILAWTPEQNELSQDPRWFKFPRWLNSIEIPPERRETMKTRNGGAPGREFVEVEFSNATLGFWAWLLGMSLSSMKTIVEMADSKRSKNDGKGFREDLVMIADWCLKLDFFTGWSACIVETLLTRTSLARAFSLRVAALTRREYDDNDADYDMSREPGERDGHLVLRHVRAMLAWSAALRSLTYDGHLSIINGELDIGLLQVPHDGRNDTAGIDAITNEFVRRFPIDDSTKFQDTARLECAWNLRPEFTGTVHAEATLMGLLTYFSEPDPSSRVDYWNALQDSTIAERMEVLVGPAVTAIDKAIGVGKKCCWCCNALLAILQDKYVSIERGSHGVIYPWSPPRVGLDTSILQKLEDRLWDELHKAIERSRPFSSTEGTSCDDLPGIDWKRLKLLG